MKKSISVVVLIGFICLTFSRCFFWRGESEREIEINESVNKIYYDLKKHLHDPGDLDAINDYLISWAAAQNIPVSYDNHKNIIMSKKATHGHEDDETTLLQCSIGIPDIKNYEAVASTLFMMKNLEEHGFLRALFTADTNEDYSGSENISASYLDADRIISIIQDNKTTFATQSAAIQNYSFSKNLALTSPIGTQAFEITIGPFPYDSSGKIYGKHPNPIKELGDFFAYAKSKGIAIELVNFNGGNSIYTYPEFAIATFVISAPDVNKFKKYFDKSAAKFSKTYESLLESSPFVYNYAAVSLPNQVIPREQSTHIFSLLYTMINGSFQKDEEDIPISNTVVTQISGDNTSLTLNVCARAKSESDFEQITSTLQIIAGLNDSEFNILNNFPAWQQESDSEIYNEYEEIYSNVMKKDLEAKASLNSSPIAIFKEKNSKLDALCLSVNFSNNVIELEILEKLLTGNSPNMLSL